MNTMMADADGNLLYMNEASSTTLKTLEQYLPSPVDQLVGQSIDIFHKNPAHQRNIIGTKSNLPHQAIIQVGPEKLDLLVNFEIQMQACNGDEQAYTAFQQQLQLNWPAFENELSSKRLLAGKALDEHLNAIQMSAIDSYSQAILNLYTYNQYVRDKKVNAGVPV